MDTKTVRKGRSKNAPEEVAIVDTETLEEPVANGKKAPAKGKGKAAKVESDVAAPEPTKEKASAKRGRGAKAKAPTPEPEEVEADEEELESEPAPPAAKKGRGKKAAEDKVEDVAPQPAKKAKGKAAKKDEEEPENDEPEVVPETAPAKRGGRGKQKAEPKAVEPEDDEEEEAPVPAKRVRGAPKERSAVSPKKAKVDEEAESNDKEEAEQPTKKGKGSRGKKEAKKVEEVAEETNEDAEEPAEEEPVAEAPKAKGKGRGKKAEAEPSAKASAPAKKGGRGRKAKATEDVDEASTEEAKSEDGPKPTLNEENVTKKRGGGRRKASTPVPKPEEVPANGVEKKSRKRGAAKVVEEIDESEGAKPSKAPKKEAKPKMNKDSTDYSAMNFELEGKEFSYKISSWNVAGLRAWVGKGGLDYIHKENPDIICLQETKCIEDQLPEQAKHIKGYHPYWLCKPGGHAGVAIYSKKMPINVTYGLSDDEQDEQGRLLTAEYEKFYLVNAYVPNAGRGLVTLPKRLRWDEKFQKYLKDLDSKKPVILTGDLNVSHQEIDLANPKSNKKNAGFTQEERDGMSKMLSLGFVDSFRNLYPDRKAYTYWTYMGNARSKNVGWRLDYFILSERLTGKVVDNVMRSEVMGSDHCPITLFLNI